MEHVLTYNLHKVKLVNTEICHTQSIEANTWSLDQEITILRVDNVLFKLETDCGQGNAWAKLTQLDEQAFHELIAEVEKERSTGYRIDQSDAEQLLDTLRKLLTEM